MSPDDPNLIRRCQAGDRGAFEILVRRWERNALNLAYRMTGSLQDAEDIRQAVFIRAYNALPNFDGRSSLSTWLYRMVMNLARNHLRSQESRERILSNAADQQGRHPHQASSKPHELEELRRAVADAVLALPQAEREVVVLRHSQGLTFARIAEILDSPITTVRSRMLAGLRSLRDRLHHGGVSSYD